MEAHVDFVADERNPGFSALKNLSSDIIQLANDYYTLFLAINGK